MLKTFSATQAKLDNIPEDRNTSKWHFIAACVKSV